jgi:serine/threonine protein kinase
LLPSQRPLLTLFCSLGCLVYGMLTGQDLFELPSGPTWSATDARLASKLFPRLRLLSLMETQGWGRSHSRTFPCFFSRRPNVRRSSLTTLVCTVAFAIKSIRLSNVSGNLLRPARLTPFNLEEDLIGHGVPVEHVPSVSAFLRSCLALDPAGRATAQACTSDLILHFACESQGDDAALV